MYASLFRTYEQAWHLSLHNDIPPCSETRTPHPLLFLWTWVKTLTLSVVSHPCAYIWPHWINLFACNWPILPLVEEAYLMHLVFDSHLSNINWLHTRDSVSEHYSVSEYYSIDLRVRQKLFKAAKKKTIKFIKLYQSRRIWKNWEKIRSKMEEGLKEWNESYLNINIAYMTLA